MYSREQCCIIPVGLRKQLRTNTRTRIGHTLLLHCGALPEISDFECARIARVRVCVNVYEQIRYPQGTLPNLRLRNLEYRIASVYHRHTGCIGIQP